MTSDTRTIILKLEKFNPHIEE